MKYRVLFLAFIAVILPTCAAPNYAVKWPWNNCADPSHYDGKHLDRGHPAVGQFIVPNTLMCTASLVGKRVAITAAHCVGGTTGSFDIPAELVLDSGSYAVVGWMSYGDGSVGVDDIAILLLEHAVEDIEPLRLTPLLPASPTELTFVGYGCESACTDPTGEVQFFGAGTKRESRFSSDGFDHDAYTSEDFWLCPGDSGGPVFVSETGELVAIASGYRRYRSGPGRDSMIFADPRIVARSLLNML